MFKDDNIQKLFTKYLQGKMEGTTLQENLYNYYRESNKTDNIKEDIFKIVEQTLVLHLREDMWGVYFGTDRDMYRQIDLLQTQNSAKKAVQDYVEHPAEMLIKMMAMQAHGDCSRNYEKTYDVEKEQIWQHLFSFYPQFSTYLEEEKQRVQESELKTREQYKDYYQSIEDNKAKPIVESYEINVPIKIVTTQFINDHPNIARLMNELVDNFNNFSLEGYIQELENKCSHSIASFNDNHLLIKFDCHTPLNKEEVTKMKEQLFSQLEHGWGASSRGRILVEKEEVTFKFLLSENLPLVKKLPNQNKLKM